MGQVVEAHQNEAFEDDEHSSDNSVSVASDVSMNSASKTEKLQQEVGQQMKQNVSYITIEAPDSGIKKDFAGDSHDNLNGNQGEDHDDLMLDGKLNGSGHFSILWDKLDYVVESKWYSLSNQRKPILDGLSGIIRSGELSAILGPSGAGKSTLIDCLLGKNKNGLRGRTRVVYDNPEIEKERRRKRPMRIATIPQRDHLLDTLTVTETFMFASKIKNAHLTYEENYYDEDDSIKREPTKRRRFNHFANVQRVIRQLNLSSCASQRCGKLSGGQYKRVSIGQELLSRPDIMILDEPTSGLDSVTCYQTINALRQLIETSPYPMAIVSTIHQPDVEVFNLFHRAYVLAPGGRSIYEGTTGEIFDTVQQAVDMIESSRKQCEGHIDANSSIELNNLKDQLQDRRVNPARLIVEIAANEYGYEIATLLNEIQRNKSQKLLSSSSYCLGAIEQRSLGSVTGSKDSVTSSTQELVSNNSSPSPVQEESEMPSSSNSPDTAVTLTVQIPKPPSYDYEAHDPARRKPELDKLLHLTSANMKQRRSITTWFKHLIYHTHRSWLTILRDPMLFTVQVALHIFVPLMISYAFAGRNGEACPIIGPLDVVDEAYRSGNILEDLNQELRNAFENLGYMFFQIYVIIFAAVCVTSLTYPLAMHVLLKEYRNGWYSMSSYFLGRTLADLPVPTFNGALAIAISYHLTGQPLSPYAWRFLSVAGLTVLATIVAQTQGLMFGAMLMNTPQAAVFVAPASTAPLVVVSGFLIRLKSLPPLLAFLGKFSYFTYLLEGFIVSRYGFNRCQCNESDFLLDKTREVPYQARGIIDIWVDTFKDEYQTTPNNTSTDLVGKLVDTISRAKTFGHEINNCSQVKPFTMLDYGLEDADLTTCFIALFAMLIAFRWLTYITLVWKIKSSI